MNVNKIYNKFLGLLALVSLVLLNSCAKEEGIPVVVDFDIEVLNNDYTVPVKVLITNHTTGAETYDWTFEGATISRSNKINPEAIIYITEGTYTIKLKASNKDGNIDQKEIELSINTAMNADFDIEVDGSTIAPVTAQIVNKSLGAETYVWEFENGTPSESTEENPTVSFTEPGEQNIKLTISNGLETYSVQKNVIVEPAMTIDFDWYIDPIDTDLQVPVVVHTTNLSSNAFTYEWTVSNGTVSESTADNPDIVITDAGTHTLTLKATNDKETLTLSKDVTVFPDNNLLTFTDVELGINTAKNTIGCFFSSNLGTVIKSSEVDDENGSLIDFAFFGFNSNFNYNQFISPDEVQNTVFYSIPNAINTKIINSQELVSTQLTASDFDLIENGNAFNTVLIEESTLGSSSFDNTVIPRIVLFETFDGRKGAIKVKSFVNNSINSYIVIDVKVQKQNSNE